MGSGAHGDTVMFPDKPSHVPGWAKRFLFDAGQLDRPMSSLSGGEQARVLIARLMLQPADVLLLDEPTNYLHPDARSAGRQPHAGSGDPRPLPAGSCLDRSAGPGRARRRAAFRRLLAVGAGQDGAGRRAQTGQAGDAVAACQKEALLPREVGRGSAHVSYKLARCTLVERQPCPFRASRKTSFGPEIGCA
jgi:hypothetical protein